MARKREVFTHRNFIVWPHYLAKHCQSYSGLGEQATHKDINFVA